MFSLVTEPSEGKVLHLDGVSTWCVHPCNLDSLAATHGLSAVELACARVLWEGACGDDGKVAGMLTLGEAIAWLLDVGASVAVVAQTGTDDAWYAPWRPMRLHGTPPRLGRGNRSTAAWLCVRGVALPRNVIAPDDAPWKTVQGTCVRLACVVEGGERQYRHGVLETRVPDSPFHVWVDAPDDKPLPDHTVAGAGVVSRALLHPAIAHRAGSVVRALATRALRWRGSLKWQASEAGKEGDVICNEGVSDELLCLCRASTLLARAMPYEPLHRLAYATMHRVEAAMRNEDVSMAARWKGVDGVCIVPVSVRHFAKLRELRVLGHPDVERSGGRSVLHDGTWYFPQDVDAAHVVGAAAELFDFDADVYNKVAQLQDKYVYGASESGEGEWCSEAGSMGLLPPRRSCKRTTAPPPALPVRLYHVQVHEHALVLRHDACAPALQDDVPRYSIENFRPLLEQGRIPQDAQSDASWLSSVVPCFAQRMAAAREQGREALLCAVVRELSERHVSVEWTVEGMDDSIHAAASSLGLTMWACLAFGYVLGARVRAVLDASKGACVAVWVHGAQTGGSFVLLDPVRKSSVPRRRVAQTASAVEGLEVGALVEVRMHTQWHAALVMRLRPDLDAVVVQYLRTGQRRLLRSGRTLRIVAGASDDLSKTARVTAKRCKVV